MRKLTTTSFAMLGLLALRDWTASELANQMTRSIGFMWPRAVSGIYVEPKSLVEHQLAEAEPVPDDRRTRARYSITERGRSALIAWLRRPSSASSFESEVALKLVIADLGTKGDALRLIEELATDAGRRNEELLEIFREYVEHRGRYQERAAVIGLTSRLYHEHYAAVSRWAAWAKVEVESWPTTDAGAREQGLAIIEESWRRFPARGEQTGNG